MLEIIKILKKITNDIIISGHQKADYDSMCSSLALALCLKKLKKNVKVYIEKESRKKSNTLTVMNFYAIK